MRDTDPRVPPPLSDRVRPPAGGQCGREAARGGLSGAQGRPACDLSRRQGLSPVASRCGPWGGSRRAGSQMSEGWRSTRCLSPAQPAPGCGAPVPARPPSPGSKGPSPVRTTARVGVSRQTCLQGCPTHLLTRSPLPTGSPCFVGVPLGSPESRVRQRHPRRGPLALSEVSLAFVLLRPLPNSRQRHGPVGCPPPSPCTGDISPQTPDDES